MNTIEQFCLDSKLFKDFKVQWHIFRDEEDYIGNYLIIQHDSGLEVRSNGLANELFFDVSLIGAVNDTKEISETAQMFYNYVAKAKENIFLINGLPRPIYTTDLRLIYQFNLRGFNNV